MLCFLIGFICLGIGYLIGRHFGEASGFTDGFRRGKVSERRSIMSVAFPVTCPACGKEYGVEFFHNYKGLM